MKRILHIVLCCLLATGAVAQAPDRNPDEFHTNVLAGQRRPMPFAFLRFDDVVWHTDLWKTIYVGERFNQFFYFPDDEYHPYGKKSLALIIWEAVVAGEIPIYEDDLLTIPIDNDAFVRRYTKADTILLEVGYDDDDNELYETVIRPRHFDGSEVKNYALRDTWFIGRQDTRQEFRHIALAPVKETYRELPNGIDIYLGQLPIFWIPMQNPAVRALLARYVAHVDPDNIVRQPSWDWVFLNQYYNAYTTRESNPYNRSIIDYLSGDNALLEAEIIEEKIFEIENSMWDY